MAAHAARAICRVQPRLRQRYGLRPEDGRQDRVDLDVAAGDGAVGVRPHARRGVS